jgi:hypothetical protein
MLWGPRLFLIAVIVFSAALFRQARSKPRDWVPPSWQTITWMGPKTRDHAVDRAGCGLVLGVVFLAASFVLPWFVSMLASR